MWLRHIYILRHRGIKLSRAAKQRRVKAQGEALRALGHTRAFISEPRSGDRDICEKIVVRDSNEVGLLIY